MNKALFVCNSVYQVFVAMWLKHLCLPDVKADILISDHMNNGRGICENLRKYGEFDRCLYVETFAYCRRKKIPNAVQARLIRFFPDSYLKEYVDLRGRYDRLYVSNLDLFSQLLYNSMVHRNPKCRLYWYEDGLSTYSKLAQGFYEATRLPEVVGVSLLLRKICRESSTYGNITAMCLFNPENMLWETPFPLQRIDKIDTSDDAFVTMCNGVFEYSETVDRYDKKYIFMEESYAAEGTPINDVELLEELAKRVGKENIMVKIHPRNPINRFAAAGFATNRNTSIPWEVILLNLKDVSDKVFLTIGSSSVLNPITVFGARIRAYSLYPLVDKENCKSALLSGDFWEAVYSIIQKYPDMITVCDTIDEIR